MIIEAMAIRFLYGLVLDIFLSDSFLDLADFGATVTTTLHLGGFSLEDTPGLNLVLPN